MLHLLVAVAVTQDYFPLGAGYTGTCEAVARERKRETVKKLSDKPEEIGR